MTKILIDRAVVEEVIATIEDSGEMMLAAIVERQDRAVEALRAALAEPVQEPDLSRCPKCGGPADNGHDREVPPNPYYCTKCMAEPVQEPVKLGPLAPLTGYYDIGGKRVWLEKDDPFPASPQRKPLTDDAMQKVFTDSFGLCPEPGGFLFRVGRAVEAAHKIGGEE